MTMDYDRLILIYKFKDAIEVLFKEIWGAVIIYADIFIIYVFL